MHWGDVQCTKCLTLVAAQPPPGPIVIQILEMRRGPALGGPPWLLQNIILNTNWQQNRHVYSCDEFKIGYGNNIGSICSPFLAKKISSKLWNHRAGTGYKCVLVSLVHHQTPPPPRHQRVSVSLLLQFKNNGYNLVHILLHIALCRFLLSIDIDFKISRLSISKNFHKLYFVFCCHA